MRLLLLWFAGWMLCWLSWAFLFRMLQAVFLRACRLHLLNICAFIGKKMQSELLPNYQVFVSRCCHSVWIHMYVIREMAIHGQHNCLKQRISCHETPCLTFTICCVRDGSPAEWPQPLDRRGVRRAFSLGFLVDVNHYPVRQLAFSLNI